MKKIIEGSSLVLLGMYGVFTFLLFLFGLFWDNKGGVSFWEKSLIDWAFVIWLVLGSVAVMFCLLTYIRKSKIYKYILLMTGAVVLINIKILVVGSADGDEVLFEFAIAHLLAISSIVYLYFQARRGNTSK